MDPGLLALAIMVGLLGLCIWSWLSKRGPTVPTDHTRTQPGRRLEGADHTTGGSE